MFEKFLIFVVYDKMKIQSNKEDAIGFKKKGDIFPKILKVKSRGRIQRGIAYLHR